MIRRLLGRGGLFLFLRGRIMAWRRWRHGLRHVDPTFYMGPDCTVERDLIAGAHSFINRRCMLQAKVRLGR